MKTSEQSLFDTAVIPRAYEKKVFRILKKLTNYVLKSGCFTNFIVRNGSRKGTWDPEFDQ